MPSAKRLRISVVAFQRDAVSAWEQGVIVNEDKLIIDMDGKQVPAPIQNYRHEPHNGVMVVIDI